jgi:hypothetical protein
MQSQYVPYVFPMFFSQNHGVFFHQDAEIAGGFSMLRASPGASVWPCASGGTSIMALRLGWGGKLPWETGKAV